MQIAVIIAITLITIVLLYLKKFKYSNTTAIGCSRKPESVNYHFTRQCNYECGFCFHTAKNSFVLPIEEAKRGLKMLRDEGSYYVCSSA